MKAFQGTARLVLLGFFGSHIIFSLCLDSQVVFPLSIFPKTLVDLGKYEVETFNDPLMGNARNLLWFQCLVCMELLLQVPFFCAALYYIGDTRAATYPDGFRAACIAYGAHTSTGLIPILSTFWDPSYDGSTQQSLALTAMYFPYLAIPAWLLWAAAMDGPSNEKPKSS